MGQSCEDRQLLHSSQSVPFGSVLQLRCLSLAAVTKYESHTPVGSAIRPGMPKPSRVFLFLFSSRICHRPFLSSAENIHFFKFPFSTFSALPHFPCSAVVSCKLIASWRKSDLVSGPVLFF